MPQARGLFHKAIVQSGSHLEALRPDEATKHALTFLAAVEVKPADLQQLAKFPTDRLLAGLTKVMDAPGHAVQERGDRRYYGLPSSRPLSENLANRRHAYRLEAQPARPRPERAGTPTKSHSPRRKSHRRYPVLRMPQGARLTVAHPARNRPPQLPPLKSETTRHGSARPIGEPIGHRLVNLMCSEPARHQDGLIRDLGSVSSDDCFQMHHAMDRSAPHQSVRNRPYSG
jgi:hypothetical protein